jgi:lipid II isoglutaminyl synthase (glutamine-hydrolysing)
MQFKNISIIIFSKLLISVVRFLHLGHGSTWPGHIALKINKRFIKDAFYTNADIKVVLIAGTNGKTTTAKLIDFILSKNGNKAFINKTGANLLNGIASTIIEKSDFFGQLNFDTAIFEVDENVLPLVLKEISPYAILILNLFRDQLDRYGEVNTIANKWQAELININDKTNLFLNGDDPQIAYIGKIIGNKKIHFFGLDKKFMKVDSKIPHDVDSIYCPSCNNKLNFNAIAYSHLGRYHCTECGFCTPKTETFTNKGLSYPLFGKYNLYNLNAAVLTVNKAFYIDIDKINTYLTDFKPAFGRQEILEFKKRKIIMLLSKNPTGFNQSIEAIMDGDYKDKKVMVLLNDRIPDGRDISWIWDTDFENLKKVSKIIISGDRAYDMGIRFKYIFEKPKIENVKRGVYSINGKVFIIEKFKEALEYFINNSDKNETLYILPTYSAMLEARRLLSGKKLI